MLAETGPGLAVDRNGLWAWIHTADAARAIAAALTAKVSVAPDTTALIPSEALLSRFLPDTVVSRALVGFESLFEVGRAHEVLGFRPEHSWR